MADTTKRIGIKLAPILDEAEMSKVQGTIDSFRSTIGLDSDGFANKLLPGLDGIFNESANAIMSFLGGDYLGAITSTIKVVINSFNSLISWTHMLYNRFEEYIDASLMSNKETRDLVLTYGFSEDEVYAWQNAMEFMGFSNEEDLWWAKDFEFNKFMEVFDDFKEDYLSQKELQGGDDWETLLEEQWAAKQLEEESRQLINSFLSHNSETINQFLTNGLELFKKLMDWVNKALGSIETMKDVKETSSETFAEYAVTGNLQETLEKKTGMSQEEMMAAIYGSNASYQSMKSSGDRIAMINNNYNGVTIENNPEIQKAASNVVKNTLSPRTSSY